MIGQKFEEVKVTGRRCEVTLDPNQLNTFKMVAASDSRLVDDNDCKFQVPLVGNVKGCSKRITRDQAIMAFA